METKVGETQDQDPRNDHSKSQTKQRNIFLWGLRGLPAQPCVHILCICSVYALVCACVKREQVMCLAILHV